MSYEHKEFVQEESAAILRQNGWATKDGCTWKRHIKKVCKKCEGKGTVNRKRFFVFTITEKCENCGGVGEIFKFEKRMWLE